MAHRPRRAAARLRPLHQKSVYFSLLFGAGSFIGADFLLIKAKNCENTGCISKFFNEDGRKICPVKPGSDWRRQAKGIMTQAVRQICEYVFHKSDILRIYAEPFAQNAASCRVLEKAGFQYEGTMRSNAVKNGKVMDMKLYSLLKGEL